MTAGQTCELCLQVITTEDADTRHTTPSGADCHANCCQECTIPTTKENQHVQH